MMTFDETQFMSLFKKLKSIDLLGPDPLTKPPFPMPASPEAGIPAGDWPSLEQVEAAVVAAMPGLPLYYQEIYGSQLIQNLLFILEHAQNTDQPELIETLTGAVYHHANDELILPLRRFMATVSDLYMSFLDGEKRAALGIPLTEKIPPLVSFKYIGDEGPFTLTTDTVREMLGSTVGVVSLPGNYRSHPLLWGALSHETAGHDLLHADPGLLEELAETVQSQLDSSGFDAELGILWSYWMDEAAADVYGALNLGPAFILNQILLLMVLNAESHGGLRVESAPIDLQGNLDPHPTDALRPYLILGVLGAFHDLEPETRDQYTEMIKSVAELCTVTTNQIILNGYLPGDKPTAEPSVRTYPFSKMAEAAQLVGQTIATAELRALGGHRILELETWDDADEQITRAIVSAMQQNQPVMQMGDDAHLLAAATVLLFQDAALYDQVTALLNEALNESYDYDPYLGAYTGS